MTNAKNSDRFLTAFNRIEQALREIVNAKNYMPFYRLIDIAKKKTVIVKKYQDELKTFADLRNAIVHNRTNVEYVIAEPHIEIVQQIEEIDQLLNRPQTVISICNKKVATFQITDTFKDVLEVIHRHKYTQFPVYDGKQFKGLLTTVGITSWLASVVVNGSFPKEMPMLQVLNFDERINKNYLFVEKHTSVIVAEELFKENIGRGRRIEALLVTEHGKPNQTLLGIVTPMDIVEKI